MYYFFTILLLVLTLNLLLLYRFATHADLKCITSLPFCYSCWPYIFLQESTEHGPKGEPRIRQIKCCWSGHYKYTRQSDNPEQLWPFVNSRARTKSHASFVSAIQHHTPVPGTPGLHYIKTKSMKKLLI